MQAADGLLKLLEHGTKSLDDACELCENALKRCADDVWLADRCVPRFSKRLLR